MLTYGANHCPDLRPALDGAPVGKSTAKVLKTEVTLVSNGEETGQFYARKKRTLTYSSYFILKVLKMAIDLKVKHTTLKILQGKYEKISMTS